MNENTNGHEQWRLLDLPVTEYETVRSLQLRLVNARRTGEFEEDVLIFTEHFPIFTLGRRGGEEFLKVSRSFLERSNIRVAPVERGGYITYHGPGQLVVYPVVSLKRKRRGVAGFVHDLEELMIQTAAGWNIPAARNPANRGVWVKGKKLGSLGLAVRRGVSFHGLALNVDLDMEPFSWIDPCGLAGVCMTSMKVEFKGPDKTRPAMELVRKALMSHAARIFRVRFAPVTLEALDKCLPPLAE